MAGVRRFSKSVLSKICESKMLGVRSGREHRFTRVWVVVVNSRVFVRSWNNKPAGWYLAFCENPMGAIHISGQEISVRARKTRGDRLLDSIDTAYADKYNTRASLKYVRGLIQARRRITTLEFIPI